MESLQIHLTRSHFSEIIVVAANTLYSRANEVIHASFFNKENWRETAEEDLPKEIMVDEFGTLDWNSFDGDGWSTPFDGGGPEVTPSEFVAIYSDGENFWALAQFDHWGDNINIFQFFQSNAFWRDAGLREIQAVWKAAWKEELIEEDWISFAEYSGIDPETPNWIPKKESDVPEKVQRILKKGISEVDKNFGQGGEFFKLKPSRQELEEKIENLESFSRGEKPRYNITQCQHCGVLQPLMVEEDLEFSIDPEWKIFGIIRAICFKCGREIYRKEVETPVMYIM